MPDVKDGGIMWLNKSTGMQFLRKDTSTVIEPADEKKKKRKTKVSTQAASE
jgi:hypothetical protein